MKTDDLLRRVIFRPYRKGCGPSFTLTLWDTYSTGPYGKSRLRYRLTQQGRRKPIFEGEDFWSSPLHSIDGDQTVESIMGFLTLQPGDTDPEYFQGYTAEQMAFCQEHAESLSSEVMARFGE